MQVDSARTFATLANCPLLLDNTQETIIFCRKKEGRFSFLSATKKEELPLGEKMRRLFGSEDYNWATIDELVEISLHQLDPLACAANNKAVLNAKGWCRFIKMKSTFGSLQEIEQKVAALFQDLLPDPARSRSPQKPAESPPLPLSKGQVQKEALSLSPRNPALVHGIENQGNWCYLDSFLQAAYASQGFIKMLQARVSDAEKALAILTNQIQHVRENSQPQIQQLNSLETKREDIEKAKIKAQALLTLVKALELPAESPQALLDKNLVKEFVSSFNTTKSFFYQTLIKHSQEDPTELFDALCINDLLHERIPLYRETNVRNGSGRVLGDEKEQILSKIFITALDKPKDLSDPVIHVAPPDSSPNHASLEAVFKGVWDTYSLEKDKQDILHQEENLSLFGGSEGEARIKAFMETTYNDILVWRKLSLLKEAPLSLPIIIKRFDAKGAKKRFLMEVPFRLEVAVSEGKSPAVYLLRSAIIHHGSSSKSGHYSTLTPDLTSIDETTGKPTRFVCQNDQKIYPVSPENAICQIETNGYFFFYDRVDPQLVQQELQKSESSCLG